MFTRFFRVLNEYGWQLKNGELTKLSVGERSNRVTGSRPSHAPRKVSGSGTNEPPDRQSALVPLTLATSESPSEAHEAGVVIKEESPTLDTMESDAYQHFDDDSLTEEEATLATAPKISSAAVKLNLQNDEEDTWDWD